MSRAVHPLVAAMVAISLAVTAAAPAEKPPQPRPMEIPPDAIGLEGVPTVRVDSARGGTTRRELTAAEAAADRLVVRIVDGRFYWTSRENQQLQFVPAGEFTYLASDPGKYIRLTRLNDRISYIEHVDRAFESITWWGELRIVVHK